MPNFSAVRTDHVLRAVRLHDELGEDEFLGRHGFKRDRGYSLVHDGESYASKAVVGVAHEFATGEPLAATDFSGGKDGAAAVLRGLGFTVTDPAELTDGPPAEGEWRTVQQVGGEVARELWAAAAYDVLRDAATTYGSTVSYKELSTQIQWLTGIATKQLLHQWVGEVLTRVGARCAAADEPLLPALCVDTRGYVGAGYAGAVAAAHLPVPDDADVHAAEQRLECYRRWASDVPEDGGSAQVMAPRKVRPATAKKAPVAEPAPTPTCPTCYMELPLTGGCNYCD